MPTCDNMKVNVYHKVHRVSCCEYSETHLSLFPLYTAFQPLPGSSRLCLLMSPSPFLCYTGFQCNFGSQVGLASAPGGYACLNESQHSRGVWGSTHHFGSIQSQRPLIALTVAVSQSSAVSSEDAGESTTATQSILSPTVHWVQLPAFSLASVF